MSTRKELQSATKERHLTACAAQQEVLRSLPLSTVGTCETCGALFVKHPTKGRITKCCNCRVEARAAYHRDRCIADPKPGFPKLTQFQSMDEVDEYLKGEKLQCLVCGNSYRGLQQHVNHRHELSAREYCLRFGIPVSRGLWGDETRRSVGDATRQYMEDIGEEGRAAIVAAMQATDHRCLNQVLVPAVANQRRNLGLVMAESPNHVRYLPITPQETPCSCCGELFTSNSHAVLTSACWLLCAKCRRTKSDEYSKEWKIKNIERYREYHRQYDQKRKEKKATDI